MGDNNVWTDTWDEGEDWTGGGARAKPDHKQITALARTGSQTGDQLWLIHDVEPRDS